MSGAWFNANGVKANRRARLDEAEGQNILLCQEPFLLDCGRTLANMRISYETCGELNAARDNAVLVVHALTGSAHASSCSGGSSQPGWWEGLIGPGKALDPGRRFIICANLLGSCYGTAGPSENQGETGLPCGADFPPVTTRDMARAQKILLDHLGIERLELATGGSLGAMVVWELAVEYPGLAKSVVPIAGGPQASAWVIALNAVARRAILDDPAWKEGRYVGEGPRKGLELARMVAMISYRSPFLFEDRFARDREDRNDERALDSLNRFEVDRYLRYQGWKLAERFDARSYLSLTEAMDLHDIGRRRGGVEAALGRISAEFLVVGISTDVLFPACEMRRSAERLTTAGKKARYAELESPYGHDAFLVEYGQLNGLLDGFLERRSGCEY
jgi:homoserine O-acetyltransferase